MPKKTKAATAGKKRSVEQLVGVIATKDKALSVKDDQIAKLKEELKQAPKVKSQPNNSIRGLESAVDILRDHGFEVFTDAKITNCRREDGKGHRSFRSRGRYEVVIARGRKRL